MDKLTVGNQTGGDSESNISAVTGPG